LRRLDEDTEKITLPMVFLDCVDMILWAMERGVVREVLRLADLFHPARSRVLTRFNVQPGI
jgi:hypothetical protein